MSLGLAVKAEPRATVVVIYCKGEQTIAIRQPGGYWVCTLCGKTVEVVA